MYTFSVWPTIVKVYIYFVQLFIIDGEGNFMVISSKFMIIEWLLSLILDQLRLNHALVWFMVNLSILRFSREKYPVIHSDCKFIIDAFFSPVRRIFVWLWWSWRHGWLRWSSSSHKHNFHEYRCVEMLNFLLLFKTRKIF